MSRTRTNRTAKAALLRRMSETMTGVWRMGINDVRAYVATHDFVFMVMVRLGVLVSWSTFPSNGNLSRALPPPRSVPPLCQLYSGTRWASSPATS
jgi:hypothetical protein